jgi:uncharacterized phosphosugar-binding protein
VTGLRYLAALQRLLGDLAEREAEAIAAVAGEVARSVAGGGVVHLFGAGHSHMVAEEVVARAGTITATAAIWPEQITDRLERVEGLGAAVLEMGEVRPGEVLFVISNSGLNPLPVDVALEGGRRGAVTVGVGAGAVAPDSPPRRRDGLRLRDVCRHFLDTGVPPGDALLDVPGIDARVGPASTIGAVAAVQAVMVEAAALIARGGGRPPIRISRNLPAGDAHNRELERAYEGRLEKHVA